MFLGQDPDSGYSPPMIELGLEGSFPFFKIFSDLIYSCEGSLDWSIHLGPTVTWLGPTLHISLFTCGDSLPCATDGMVVVAGLGSAS